MEDYLSHHGILGQKWGVRRYQNLDGSLTEEGYKRYKSSSGLRSLNQLKKDYPNLDKDTNNEDSYVALTNEILNKCGDWYMSDWKTPQLKKIHNERRAAEKQLSKQDPHRKYLKLRDEVYEQKLKDLNIEKYNKWYTRDLYYSYKDKLFFEAMNDPKVKKAEKYYKDHHIEYYKKCDELRKKYDDKMFHEILMELGYEDTPAAREYIYYAVIID